MTFGHGSHMMVHAMLLIINALKLSRRFHMILSWLIDFQ